MTFACIGAVMRCTTLWTGLLGEVEQDRIGVVVFADNAKYDLGLGRVHPRCGWRGHPHQAQPKVTGDPRHMGCIHDAVHDFFKPRKEITGSQ